VSQSRLLSINPKQLHHFNKLLDRLLLKDYGFPAVKATKVCNFKKKVKDLAPAISQSHSPYWFQIPKI
jgi:hypothetical protein